MITKHANVIIKSIAAFSVEPALFFTVFAFQITKFINQNLYLNKMCRPSSISEPVDLKISCEDEKAGIEFDATVYSNSTTFVGFANVVICIFANVYSDLCGKKRKIFFLMPIFGVLALSTSAALQSYWWTWPSRSGVWLNALIAAFGGGYPFIMTFSTMYICDQTSKQNRFSRMFILACVRELGMLASRGSAGFLLRNFGFLRTYLLCGLIALVALVCAIKWVHDPVLSEEEKDGLAQNSDKVSRVSLFLRLLKMGEIGQSIKMILWSGKITMRHRFTIIVLFVTGTIAFFVYTGEESVLYLYLRYRFQWDEEKYSAYIAYKILAGNIGGLICTVIMSKVYKVHDCLIGSFACFWDTVAAIGFFLASNDQQLYLVPLVDIFHGIAITIFNSYISKFFTSDEFGRLNSVYMLFILSAPFSNRLYNHIFNLYKDSVPNIYFLISIGINTTTVLGYLISYFLSKDMK